MKRYTRIAIHSLFFTILLVGLASLATQAHAQNEGQDLLDEATQLKVSARSLNDLEKVAELCEKAIKKGLDEENKAFATNLLSSSLVQHSQRLCQAIFDRQPPSPQWPLLRQVAMENLKKAVDYNDQLADAYLLMGKLQALPRGDEEEALELVDRGIKLYKEKPRKLSEALVLRARIVKGGDAKLEDLKRALEADPTNADAWKIQATVLLALGKFEESVKSYNKALEQNDGDIQIRIAMTEALINLEKYDEALKSADAAIKTDPNSAAAYLLRSRIYAVKDDLDKCLADANRSIELNPQNLVAVLFRARIHLIKDNLDEAKVDVNRILQFRPDLPQALTIRSMISAAEDKYAAAIADMEKVVKSEPSNASWQLQLGSYYSASGRPRKAIEVFSNVIKRDKENTAALSARANSQLSIGNHQKAIDDYETALKLAPKNSNMLNNLAWVLATSPEDKMRNGKRALELALKACEVTEYKAAHILSTLAAAYAETGDFKMAIKWSSKAVELGKEGDVAEQLQEELDSYKESKPWRERQKTDEKPELQNSDLEI